MSLLTRKRQVLSKLEASEGVAESLAAADAKTLAYNPRVSFDVNQFVRDPARATLSNIGSIPGKRPGGLTFGLELRGSGSAGTDPDWVKHWKACGCKVNTLKSITIGAVTSGPFLHGETVTGGTSTATGRVIINTANGTTTLYLVVLTGTFQSGEVLTGGTSGATATTGSTASTVGSVIEPDSTSSVPSQTMAGYEDGLRKSLKGCRGNLKLNLKSGEPGMMSFDFKGVENGVVDGALVSPTYETTKPPAFLSATFSVDTVALKISELEIDLGSEPSPVDDITGSRGISHFAINKRRTVGSFPGQMVLAATHDFHTKWFAGSEMVMDCSWGSTAGNKFRLFARAIQYTKVEDEDVNGIAYAKAAFDVIGTLSPGDDEWALLCL